MHHVLPIYPLPLKLVTIPVLVVVQQHPFCPVRHIRSDNRINYANATFTTIPLPVLTEPV